MYVKYQHGIERMAALALKTLMLAEGSVLYQSSWNNNARLPFPSPLLREALATGTTGASDGATAPLANLSKRFCLSNRYSSSLLTNL